jgi:ribosome-binding factor A
MSQGNPRRERVAQALRDILAEMLDREIKDPRVRAAGLASVHHVELNRDMSVARVFVSFLGPAETDERLRARALAGLEASAGFLRGPVGRRLRLRHAPELRFVLDDSTAFQQRITELVRGQEAAEDEGDDAKE